MIGRAQGQVAMKRGLGASTCIQSCSPERSLSAPLRRWPCDKVYKPHIRLGELVRYDARDKKIYAIDQIDWIVSRV